MKRNSASKPAESSGGDAWGSATASKPQATDAWSNIAPTNPYSGGGWGDSNANKNVANGGGWGEESKIEKILEEKEPGIHPCIVLLS